MPCKNSLGEMAVRFCQLTQGVSGSDPSYRLKSQLFRKFPLSGGWRGNLPITPFQRHFVIQVGFTAMELPPDSTTRVPTKSTTI
jgi:hypothetical protein